MKTVSDAQRDSQRVWSYLDRLFDWAGNRSKPMPPSDLLEIRAQVTDSLTRLVHRADDLERAPLLRSVDIASDGNRTVTLDMRDGTTRKFQTRADWFDDSPTLGDPVPAEVIELREKLANQISETTAESQLVLLGEQEIIVLKAELEAARKEMGDKRALASGQSSDEVDALLREVEERSLAKIKEVEKDRDQWRERYTSTAKTIEEMDAGVENVRKKMAVEMKETAGKMTAEIVRLEADRDEWQKRYNVAATVIDEALPAISDVLFERTRQLEEAQAELEALRDE